MRTIVISLVAAGLFSLALVPAASLAQTPGSFGIRGGVGTDVNGGLAYGAGLNYLVPAGLQHAELGVLVFGGSFEETTDEGIHTYEEKTDIFVIGLAANFLMGYERGGMKPFFLAGVGLASVNVEWEEKSRTDTSLGTPLPGGGSMQSEDGSGGGVVFNVGGGYAFAGPLDVRLEVPVIVTFAPPGGASAVVPTAILTLGARF